MAEGKQTKKKKKSALPTVLLVLALFLGIGIMAYPTVSDWWNSLHQSRAIASYVEQVESADGEKTREMLARAAAYNEALARKENRLLMTEEEKALYRSLLDVSGTGILGYLQIPVIGVNLPIYHGTEEAALQVAVGHLEWTSLPVGGESTHAVVSGHRGLPSARLFTDLDKMTVGDVFLVTVLNQTLTYQVDQIRIVKPDEIQDLAIVEGQDYMTLLTCTPYGINTHRMLVRGRRIANAEEDKIITVDPGATKIPTYITIPAVGIPLLFVFLTGLLIYDRLTYGRDEETDPDRLYAKYRAGSENKEEAERDDPPQPAEPEPAGSVPRSRKKGGRT